MMILTLATILLILHLCLILFAWKYLRDPTKVIYKLNKRINELVEENIYLREYLEEVIHNKCPKQE